MECTILKQSFPEIVSETKIFRDRTDIQKHLKTETDCVILLEEHCIAMSQTVDGDKFWVIQG